MNTVTAGEKMDNQDKCWAIVKKYRYQLGANFHRLVSQEEFGEMLVEGLANTSISRSTIVSWENDKWDPDTDLLLKLVARYAGTSDWRGKFAQDCLRAKLPEVFEAGVLKFEEIPVGV